MQLHLGAVCDHSSSSSSLTAAAVLQGLWVEASWVTPADPVHSVLASLST